LSIGKRLTINLKGQKTVEKVAKEEEVKPQIVEKNSRKNC